MRGSGDARVVVALNFSDAAASGVCSIPTLGRDNEAIAVSLDAHDVVGTEIPEPHSRPAPAQSGVRSAGGLRVG